MKIPIGTILAAAVGFGTTLGFADEPILRDTFKGHTERVFVLAFSPDGKSLASRSGDGTIRLWDVAAGTGTMLAEKGWLPAPVAFSLDSKTLVASSAASRTLLVCDLATGKNVTVNHGPKGAAAFSPEGKWAVQEDGNNGVRLRELTTPFDLTTAKEPVALPDSVVAYPGTSQPAVAFSPDGATLAIKNKDENDMVWDVASAKLIATLPKTAGDWFIFSPDGKILAVASGKKDKFFALQEQAIKFVDAATGKEIATAAQGPNDPPFNGIVFSPDGKKAASGSVYSLKVWDANNGKSLGVFQKPPATIMPPVVFSPSGNTVAAACSDRTVLLWNVANGKRIATLKDCACTPAFSPDGILLAAGGMDGPIKLWTLPSDKPAGK